MNYHEAFFVCLDAGLFTHKKKTMKKQNLKIYTLYIDGWLEVPKYNKFFKELKSRAKADNLDGECWIQSRRIFFSYNGAQPPPPLATKP